MWQLKFLLYAHPRSFDLIDCVNLNAPAISQGKDAFSEHMNMFSRIKKMHRAYFNGVTMSVFVGKAVDVDISFRQQKNVIFYY